MALFAMLDQYEYHLDIAHDLWKSQLKNEVFFKNLKSYFRKSTISS